MLWLGFARACSCYVFSEQKVTVSFCCIASNFSESRCLHHDMVYACVSSGRSVGLSLFTSATGYIRLHDLVNCVQLSYAVITTTHTSFLLSII